MAGFFPPNYQTVPVPSASSGGPSISTGTYYYSPQSGPYANHFTSIPIGDYLIEFDSSKEALTIKDAKNKECISIQNNTIFLDGKTLYQVIFEVVQMIVGKQSLAAWLTDENTHKRAFAKELHESLKVDSSY